MGDVPSLSLRRDRSATARRLGHVKALQEFVDDQLLSTVVATQQSIAVHAEKAFDEMMRRDADTSILLSGAKFFHHGAHTGRALLHDPDARGQRMFARGLHSQQLDERSPLRAKASAQLSLQHDVDTQRDTEGLAGARDDVGASREVEAEVQQGLVTPTKRQPPALVRAAKDRAGRSQ